MRCAQCHFENREGVRFCEECGARLDLVCPNCGSAVPPDRKFCGSCGQALSQPTGTPSRPPPEVHTPPHLAEKILTSRAALEGERKQVTVLFADLKGSMELLADRDPEEARKLLDPVLEHMMEAVHRYEGTVNQVMGDGIMALFGAPIAHEDHAASHAREALAFTRRLGARGNEAHALCLAGEIASTAGTDDAESSYREALTLAQDLGMRPLVAHCHLGLGRLYRQTGKRQEAQEHLTTAISMYREMDMRFWLERAEADLRGVG